MNLFNFFETKTQRKHPFGRGINAKPSKDEEELFIKSYEAFEKKDILNAYEYFFKSLENFCDETSNENIILDKEDEKLNFTIYQGTAKVTGYITDKSLYAETLMLEKESAHIALKRYILERNYQLTYSCYFSENGYIKMKIFIDNATMSPQKIFFPIREIALNADFDKEYMRSEFPNTALLDTTHLQALDDKELKIKYENMHRWIEELENKIATLPSNDNSGMQSFEYLLFFFKIDYLLVPKYEIYQKISKEIQDYFSNETNTTEAKNDKLRKYIQELKEIDFEEFSTKFYNAKYTFNPTEKTSQEEINTFIDEALIKIRWYKNNRYTQIIPTIYNYISFYLLYNYGLNPITKDLLHTLVEIQNPTFFKELDYPTLYDKENNSFSKRAIISNIEDIIEPHKERYKHLEAFGEKLKFDSLNEFSNSFFMQLKHLNFEEI